MEKHYAAGIKTSRTACAGLLGRCRALEVDASLMASQTHSGGQGTPTSAQSTLS